MRRTLMLLASLAIILLGLWGSAVIYLDEQRLKSIVSSHLSAQSGRKVDIRGSLSLRLFPRPRIHAEDVVVAAPEGFDGPKFLSVDELSMSVRLLPLVTGSLTPREVRLSGATMNLYSDEIGRSSVDGLVRSPDTGIRRGAELLATRQMRLEDIRIVINDTSVDQSRTVNIELVEFDQFAFDEALAFRFRGNLGDPPLLSMIDVEGLLMVPSTRERPVRLSNMRLSGELAGSGVPIQLFGNVSLLSVPEFELELEDGRLELADQQVSIVGHYIGWERPYLQLDIQAERLAFGLETDMTGEGNAQLLALLGSMDSDVEARIGELQMQGMTFEGINLRLSGRDGQLLVEDLEGMMPGAVVSGHGGWHLTHDPAEGGVEMTLSVDDAGQLLAALDLPPAVEGIGQVHWSWLRSPPLTGAGRLAEGRFELWDGRLKMADDESVDFYRMAGSFMHSPGVFDVPEFALTLPDVEFLGWLSVALETGSIGGRLVRVDEGSEISLAGLIGQPELSEPLLPDPRPTDETGSGNDGASDEPQ